MVQNISLAIIEDNTVVRANVESYMLSQPCIGQIGSFADAESFLWADNTPEKYYDAVLLDIELPNISGIDALNEIRLKYPHAEILMYTMFEDSDKLLKAISLGAVGYVLKRDPLETVLQAIQTILGGGSYLSPAMARKLLNYFHPSSVLKKKISLTGREEQVMNGLNNAMSYQQIADSLHVSIDTVRTYVRKIYTKMQVKSKSQLLRKIQEYFGHQK